MSSRPFPVCLLPHPCLPEGWVWLSLGLLFQCSKLTGPDLAQVDGGWACAPPPPNSWVPLQGPVPVLAFNRASSSWNPAPSCSQDTFQQSSFSAAKFRTHPHLLASHVNRAELHNQHRPPGMACSAACPILQKDIAGGWETQPPGESCGVCQRACGFLRARPNVPPGVYSLKESLKEYGLGLLPLLPLQELHLSLSLPSSLLIPARRLPLIPFFLTHCCAYAALEMGLGGEWCARHRAGLGDLMHVDASSKGSRLEVVGEHSGALRSWEWPERVPGGGATGSGL